MQIQLTDGEARQAIFSLSYYYQVSGVSSYIDTANMLAEQATLQGYFDGINIALGIEYPLPAEPPQDDLLGGE